MTRDPTFYHHRRRLPHEQVDEYSKEFDQVVNYFEISVCLEQREGVSYVRLGESHVVCSRRSLPRIQWRFILGLTPASLESTTLLLEDYGGNF